MSSMKSKCSSLVGMRGNNWKGMFQTMQRAPVLRHPCHYEKEGEDPTEALLSTLDSHFMGITEVLTLLSRCQRNYWTPV